MSRRAALALLGLCAAACGRPPPPTPAPAPPPPAFPEPPEPPPLPDGEALAPPKPGAPLPPPPRETSPADVLEDYEDALRDGDLEAARKLAVKPRDEEWMRRLEEALEERSREIASGHVVTETVHTRMQGRWALSVQRVHDTREGAARTSLRECLLLRQRNAWRVVPDALREDPGVLQREDGDHAALFDWLEGNRTALEKEHLSTR